MDSFHPIFAHGEWDMFIPVIGMCVFGIVLGYTLGLQRQHRIVALSAILGFAGLFAYTGHLIGNNGLIAALPAPLSYLVGFAVEKRDKRTRDENSRS